MRDIIHEDVCDKGFDRELGSFVESYGSKMLDASLLLLPSVGFLPPEDPRIRGTIAAIERHLMRDGFVLRHDPREVIDEVQPIEGAFLACTLWLADAHVLAGDTARAQTLFDRVARIANDVGLLAEEYDTQGEAADRQFPAGADAYRADQHRAQSQRGQARGGEAGGAKVEVVDIAGKRSAIRTQPRMVARVSQRAHNVRNGSLAGTT